VTSLSGLASSASSLLGGGPPAAAPQMQKVAITFKKSGAIDDSGTDAPGATALQHPNIFDPNMPIEFLHFGHQNTDANKSFVHASLADDKAGVIGQSEPGSRAFMFRAALEREAILIGGFITCAQSVVQDMKDGEGPTAGLLGAVNSLLGGSTSAQGPDPSQLNPYLSATTSAGAKINVASIQYKVVHQTGIDLHQAWSNFDKFAPNMAASASGNSGSGLLGNLPTALPLPSLPGVGDVMKTVMGILFKMYDIYEAMYLKLRDAYESTIRENCYNRTMEAIRARETPVFDVWSVQPDPSDTDNPANLLNDTGVAPVDQALGKVNKAYDDASSDVAKAQKKWADFWNTDPKAGPGQTELQAILDAAKSPSDLIFSAFTSTLNIGDLPGFVKTALGKVIDACTGMLDAIYLQLQNPDVANKMDEQGFLAAGRKYLDDVLSGLLKDLIPSMNLNIPGLGAVNPGAMAGKGISVLDDEVGKDIDPILDFALHSLHDKMQSARLAAMNNKSMTMEVYLAQLPMLIALMARNTFFPVWQLIAEKVFGALGAGAALAMSPVASMMQKAKNAASDAGKKAQDLDSKVKSAANNAASSADSAASRLGGNPLGGAADGLASQAGSLADSVLGTGSSGQGGSGSSASSGGFPGSARLNQGMGIDITKSEWDDVDSNQKVTVE
jgi:hypothetical protein